jgi:hypothetical protein
MSDDGMTEIVLGLLFTMAGVATLILPLPVICVGALIFGPILFVIGLAKAAGGGGRRRAYPHPYYYPPPYARPPPYVPQAPVPPSAAPGGTAPGTPAPPGGVTRTCPECGRVSTGAKFCPTCGLRFEG